MCLNIGCIPSKSLIHNAKLFSEGKKLLEKCGAKVDLSAFDYTPVWNASRAAADRLSKGVNFLLKKNCVDLVQGTARLSGAHTVAVEGPNGTLELEAPAILLATGSRPRPIPGFEFDEKRIFSSTGMLMSAKLPKRLFILGAGAIGMEFAYVMNAFGVEVTVAELMPRVLPLEDEEASKVVEKEFRARGVTVYTGAKASGAELKGERVLVHLSDAKGAPLDVEADAVLVSVGRAVNTEEIGLDALGVRTERGFLVTGDYHETSCAGIYAVGDITTYPQLAHSASKAGEIVAERVAHVLKGTPNPREPTLDRLHIPSAVYCEPQVASFGVSEASAKSSHIRYEVACFPYRGNGRAVAEEAVEGQVKVVFDPATKAILGASIVGSGAADTIHEILLASKAELTLEEVAELVHAHPSVSETVMEAAKAALGHAIHI